eukprot:gnl/MRDRNA2_/MRDRNA2_32887_c0_seq1.p1 gnl/MRDRNA2_/MRDRNA2_32887_c0~~gnl/MRDRNA2_/MRDRNA2_32887_c0_seq1.p1  ORF type:complete len:397 (-),score=65.66 gnl/MRDRNA2_/MRDRNA2_32887_c0_seq1:39-1229(-)
MSSSMCDHESVESMLLNLASKSGIRRMCQIHMCFNEGCKMSWLGYNPGQKLQVCNGCKAARYCSKACQKEHWKNGHKKHCLDSQRTQELRRLPGIRVDEEAAETLLLSLTDKHLEQPWPKRQKHIDCYLAFAAQAELDLGQDTAYTLMLQFPSMAAASAFREQPPTGVHVSTMTLAHTANTEKCQSEADHVLRRLHEQCSNGDLIIGFEITFGIAAGVPLKLTRFVSIPRNQYKSGDTVELRRPHCDRPGYQTATVVSVGSCQRRYVVRFACGELGEIWENNMRPPESKDKRQILLACPVDEDVHGLAARRKYRKGIEETYFCSTGKSLSAQEPHAAALLRDFEISGRYFPVITVKTLAGAMFIHSVHRAPDTERFFVDLPDTCAGKPSLLSEDKD